MCHNLCSIFWRWKLTAAPSIQACFTCWSALVRKPQVPLQRSGLEGLSQSAWRHLITLYVCFISIAQQMTMRTNLDGSKGSFPQQLQFTGCTPQPVTSHARIRPQRITGQGEKRVFCCPKTMPLCFLLHWTQGYTVTGAKLCHSYFLALIKLVLKSDTFIAF